MVRLENIYKYYYCESSVTQALRNVNLEFSKGEFVAITGESGSGKTTLLNVISGIDTYDEGEMYVNGQPTFQYDDDDWEEYRRDKIGFVFQNYNLIGHYTVLDNMISALLILGVGEKKAEKKALKYLEKVGLKGFEKNRASKLSSGQKQRLAIARALAKETDIIMADEPTGNLDSETGLQIIKLLAELSKEKLVIMVTHNYEQAQDYVTRKVKIHDGEIVLDVAVNTDKRINDKAEQPSDDKNADAGEKLRNQSKNTQADLKDKKSLLKSENESTDKNTKHIKEHLNQKRKEENSIARYFAWKNFSTQKLRGLLFIVFFMVVSTASFLFLGQIYSNIDDSSTKKYDDSVYYNGDKTRISVRKKDGTSFNKSDIEKLNKIKYVKNTDICDKADDINYYCEEGKDYKYSYGAVESDGSSYGAVESDDSSSSYSIRTQSENNWTFAKGIKKAVKQDMNVNFIKKNKFMRSVSCITKSDLVKGRLPKKNNEVVVYSKDSSVVGTTKRFYFTAKNIWGMDGYYYEDMKITGCLKEETEQAYFAESLCNMLSSSADGAKFKIDFMYDTKTDSYQGSYKLIPIYSETRDNLYDSSVDMTEDEDTKDRDYDYRNGVPSGEKARASCNTQVTLNNLGTYDETYDEDATAMMGTDRLTITKKDKNGELTGESDKLVLEVTKEVTDYSDRFIEISKHLYYKYFKNESNQAAVYISNYAKTDKVIKSIEKLDKNYEAVSAYRMSLGEYNDEKVSERLVTLGIALGVLLMLIILEIFILRSLMKIKIKDYFVLKFIGMKLNTINKISIMEMFSYCAVTIVFVIVAANIIALCGSSVMIDMLAYYTIPFYLVFIVYNLILCGVTVKAFNKLLVQRMIKN